MESEKGVNRAGLVIVVIVLVIVACLIGVGIGLFLGWVVFPVQWVNAGVVP